MNKKRGIKIRLTIPHNVGVVRRIKRLSTVIWRLLIIAWRRIKATILWRKRSLRFGTLSLTAVIVLAQIVALVGPFLTEHTYALGTAESLLTEKEPLMAEKLLYDAQKQAFNFDSHYTIQRGVSNSGGGGVTATAYADASKGVSVTDTTNKVNFKMTPKFRAADGQKDGNRIVYPLMDHDGWAVYTMSAIGTKEDIVLESTSSDTASFDYEMDLGGGLEARLEADGGIGVYGNKLFSSDIATGTEKDAALLKKAQQNAPKNSLLFTIPAPTIKETDRTQTSIKAAYELNGTHLKVSVSGLKAGNYPLTIDPSIYVVTASQFMYGNNETNINFDVANKLIKKGRTTGARFDSWQNTANLPTGQFGAGTVASGGYLYQVGGATATGGGVTFSTQGSSTYLVPYGVSTIDVKVWGGGGGSGGSYAGYAGGAGGGGGYVSSTISVTPGETLNLYVGGAGGAGNTCSGFFCGGGTTAGGGGASSNVYRGGTPLLVAGGGGGGAGSMNSLTGGGDGGAGGGSTGVNGSPNVAGQTNGGGGGGTSSGGAGGIGNCNGATGAFLLGGGGGQYSGGCGAGGNANGGVNNGAAGGTGFTGAGNGGGGGGGYYGGGGGAHGNSTGNTGGGGGGGGSSYTTGSNVVSTAGSGTSPGNSSDTNRGTAGQGGASINANSDGAAGTNGLIFISTPSSGNLAGTSVNWAKFDPGNGTVTSANPGSGACGSWCSSSSYNLPANRANLSLVAYNGYLYAMGGNDENGTAALNHKSKTIYVAKLGANGEPRLWHPTDTNQANWDYWYHDDTNMTLPSERIQGAAVAYNNKMYFVGGVDNSSATGAATSTVWTADILPNGKIGTWSTSTALTSGGPGATFGATALVYNDYLYLVGGAGSVGGTPFSTNVYYIKLSSTGALASSWASTNSFATGRTTGGGANATIWGGYMYISGGCSATNSSNYCSSVLSDTQIASINADGSLGTWVSMGNVSNLKMGASLLAWRDTLYYVGGCWQQDMATGVCIGGAQNGITYAVINQDGDISTTSSSVASGSGSCTGATPTSCNTPATASVGNYLNSTAISNGYLYVIGGCTNIGCTTTSGGTAFTQISSSGALVQPAACPSGSTATNGWCVLTATISGGIAAATPVVYNDTIYLVGGSAGTTLKNAINRATVTPTTGLLSSWSADTMTSIGATSVKYTYAAIRANPSGAGSNPAYMYIMGGCTTASGPNCAAYTQAVYRCNIIPSGAVGSCSTSNQLQIGTITGASGVGLAMASGAIYGSYIYLAGGSAPGTTETNKVRYAKFDNSNNIVTAGTGWVESSQTLSTAVRGAAAYAYNGYLYVVGGINSSSGIKNTINYIKLNTNTGDLDSSGWKQSLITTAANRWGHAIAVSNAYAYVIGGCTTGTTLTNCSAATTNAERYTMYNNNSGAPAGWSTSANSYSTARYYQGSTVLNGYIYVAGGCTTFSPNDCSGATANVQRAQIDSTTGAIGSWSNTTAALPTALGGGKLVNAGGTLYFIGGTTTGYASYSTNVYYANPTGTGDVTSWSTASNGLPQGRSFFGAAVWNNRMYVLGGRSSSCTNSACGTVYISPQQNSGGNITAAWTTSTNSFSVNRLNPAAVAYGNNLYILGGLTADGGTYLSDTQFSKIDTSTGALSTWSYSTAIPAGLSMADAFAANGYIYLVGGYRNGSVCSTGTMIAPISANTTIASGNNPTGLGSWFETNTPFSGGRYGAAGAYSNGKVYLLGGYCPNAAVSPSVQQTTLLTQPQVAKYSISFDTDTNVYPQSFLFNGVDNSIGAQWQLKYRTMSDPGAVTNLGTGIDCSSSVMSNWGQETNYGNLTLASIGTYTALDASGANMSCGRYYNLNVSVDAQNSFAYPDDTSKGPTITDVSLRYTSAPSKRSLHGRSFINGIQTPLDTPAYAN